MKKIGAISVRVSTDMQTEYSPDSQIKICQDYADKHDIYVPPENIYRDDGISGKSAIKRGDFMRMINDAQKDPRPFDVLLIYSFSRFARNKYEAVTYKHLLRNELGIEVISVTQPLPNTPDGVLLESLYEGMDEQYILNLAKESMRGKKEKAGRGEHMGHAPFGYWYDKNTKTLLPKDDEAEIIKMVFNDYLQPDGTLNGICAKLNQMGVLTKHGGDFWNAECLKYILRNPVYKGVTRLCVGGYTRKDPNSNENYIIRDGKHQGIIEAELWDKVQQKIDNCETIYGKRTKAVVKHDYWLRGLLKCSNCGKNLVMVRRNNSRKKPYFQCNWYNKKRCHESHQIKCSDLEDAILEEIRNTFLNKLDVQVVATDKRLDEVAIINRSIEKTHTKLERVKMAYENEVDTLEEYKEKKTRLNNELTRLEEELQRALESNERAEQKERVYKLCETAYDTLKDPNIDVSIKYKLAHEMIEQIIYSPKENALYITYRA